MPAVGPKETPRMTPRTAPPAPAGWPVIDELDSHADLTVRPAAGWYAAAKTVTDLTLALALLVPGLPVILACWSAVKLTSPGPGFYTQTRVGRHGRKYTIFKIRTMAANAEPSGAQWARENDARVTPLGRFLRATHLDELPQLFNVLLGHMSLVGPRPERPELIQNKGLAERVPGYGQRLLVKPGVTGLAQLQLPADSDLSSVRHKVVYDLYYVEYSSLWLDLRILAATVLKALGVGPTWLRRLFLLPTRVTVAEAFLENLTSPSPSTTLPGLQPA
jgi:lipopolysaccharide/colanic/teichoic acid biosynthesis glycosyltransferase